MSQQKKESPPVIRPMNRPLPAIFVSLKFVRHRYFRFPSFDGRGILCFGVDTKRLKTTKSSDIPPFFPAPFSSPIGPASGKSIPFK